MGAPTILLLDGGSYTSLPIARELTEDLDATVIGVGTTRYSRLLRSRYCDVRAIAPPTDHEGYVEAIDRLVEHYRPDVLLPVGYDSTSRIEAARSRFTESVALTLPSSEAFATAIDKRATRRCAERLGLPVPAEYTDLVAAAAERNPRPPPPPDVPFPVFVKPRWEVDDGHATTAIVDRPDEFWPTYDRIAADAPNGEVLVQEYVDGSDSTLGCGAFVSSDGVELVFSHEELRSVPRRGGSGTHLRVLRDRSLERDALALLRDLDWNGIALVEFKRRRDGSAVLMEINPKFWASYALASSAGYRFASTVVANALELPIDPSSPSQDGEMVFPLRELYHCARHRDEGSPLDCLVTVARPDVSWSVDVTDLRAWLTPPAAIYEKLPLNGNGSRDAPLVESSPRVVGDRVEGHP